MFRLHEVGPLVHGGLIAWPFERADEIMGAYKAMTAEAPRELAAWLILLHAPPAPFVPVEWHGEKLCAMAVCYSGDLGRTDEALAPIRALGEPVVDLLDHLPYTAAQLPGRDRAQGHHYFWRTGYLAEVDDALLSTMRDTFAECPIPGAELGILHLEGAINEHAEDDGQSTSTPVTSWASSACGSLTNSGAASPCSGFARRGSATCPSRPVEPM